MNEKSLKEKIINGLVWKFGERIIAQGVSFIISLVLARLLLPDQYGVVSLILVFINIANVFVSDGLGAALVQKKESSQKDFSTMFFCSLILSIVLYAFIFVFAPIIAAFYQKPEIVIIIRVMALQLPLSAVKTIQHAYVSKKMLFKKFFFSTLGGTLVSGVIGIIMALNGAGVWALVEQYLVNSLIDMLVLFATVGWRPSLDFDINSAKAMFSYSSKLLAASLINTIYNESRNLVIGKRYTESDLAYNSKGSQFPALLINNINTSISSVLFPAMSQVHDDNNRVKEMTRMSMQISSYIIFPIMIGLSVVGQPLIRVLLTEKWLPCVPFLQIYCIYWMFQPCLTANNEALKAVGRTDICLKLEIIKKVIGFSLIIITMRISVMALALSNVVFAFISTVLNMIPNKKILDYGVIEQFLDLSPAFLISLCMGIAVYAVKFLLLNDYITIFLQILVGVIVYIGLSVVVKPNPYRYLLRLLKRK